MPDADFEAAKAELAAALDARLAALVESIFNYQPQGTHPFRTYVTDGNDRIVRIDDRTGGIGDRVLAALVDGGNSLRQVVADTSGRTAALVGGVTSAHAKLDAIAADLSAIKAKLGI